MSDKVKRWTPNGIGSMKLDSDGYYVRYRDYEELRKRLMCYETLQAPVRTKGPVTHLPPLDFTIQPKNDLVWNWVFSDKETYFICRKLPGYKIIQLGDKNYQLNYKDQFIAIGRLEFCKSRALKHFKDDKIRLTWFGSDNLNGTTTYSCVEYPQYKVYIFKHGDINSTACNNDNVMFMTALKDMQKISDMVRDYHRKYDYVANS